MGCMTAVEAVLDAAGGAPMEGCRAGTPPICGCLLLTFFCKANMCVQLGPVPVTGALVVPQCCHSSGAVCVQVCGHCLEVA